MDRYIIRHINRLMLDPNNYRFIDSKDYKKVEERDIGKSDIQLRTYNLLVGRSEDGISDLIQSFKANGILKLDPIQVRALPDSYFLVVEGNRRTAALKYLYEQYQRGNEVGKLREEDFKSVEIVLISDESPVQHLITMGLHHISGKKKWSPVNQAQLIHDLRYKHNMSEDDICNSLAITRHGLRRSVRILALIERYKKSDYGDQFQSNMYSIFEEVIRKVELKKWLKWNDEILESEDKINEERLFSWISKEEIVDSNEQIITKEPIITKSQELRELADFINDPKAVDRMEESRSISAGFAFSDAVGETRLKNAMDNITKEVQTAFQFSDFMQDEDYSKIQKLKDKLDRLIPANNAFIDISERLESVHFKNTLNAHFTSFKVVKFKKLEHIEITKLKRVNIFAGGNNTGKTSVLEMFYLMTQLNNISSLIDMEKFRGRFYEFFPTKWFDNLFGDNIELECYFNETPCSLSISKKETEENIDKSRYLSSIVSDANVNGDNLLSTVHLFSDKEPELYFQKSQVLCQASFSSPYRYNEKLLKKAHAKAVEERYFEEIIAFIREKMDKTIEKIDMTEIEKQSRFMVSSSKSHRALDITKYGEGMQRVFEIALLMGYSRNGILCIDELDSAIHKSLLIDFTQFIQEAAERFNVQVFLSTHSKECIDAFVENSYPDDDLTAFSLTEVDNKIVCRFLEGNKLKQLVETINIDIR